MKNYVPLALSIAALTLAAIESTPIVSAARELVIPRNSVGTSQIKPGAVHRSDIATDAITSSKVRDGSLLAKDLASTTLPLWAVVRSDGVLIAGRGVTQAMTPGVGRYTVDFRDDVSKCAPVAGLAELPRLRAGESPAAEIQVGVSDPIVHPQQVDVAVRTSLGVATATFQAFSIAVFC